MQETIQPAKAIEGIISLPGDKSISHRYAMIAAIAEGQTSISNYSTGADCQSTLAAVEALGAKVERGVKGDVEAAIVIHGSPDKMLRAPADDLDAGNSGSTIRMLSGILAGQSFTSQI